MDNHTKAKELIYKSLKHFKSDSEEYKNTKKILTEIDNSPFEAYYKSFIILLAENNFILEYFYLNDFFLTKEELKNPVQYTFKENVISSYVSYCFKELSINSIDFFCSIFFRKEEIDYKILYPVKKQLLILHKKKSNKLYFYLYSINIMRLFNHHNNRTLKNILKKKKSLEVIYKKVLELNNLSNIKQRISSF